MKAWDEDAAPVYGRLTDAYWLAVDDADCCACRQLLGSDSGVTTRACGSRADRDAGQERGRPALLAQARTVIVVAAAITVVVALLLAPG